jgi:hypothetical protein
MDLLSFCRSHRSISNRLSLNKVAIIIPNPQSGPSFIPAPGTAYKAHTSSRNFSFQSGFNPYRWSGNRTVVFAYQRSHLAETFRSFGDHSANQLIVQTAWRHPETGNLGSVLTEVHTYEVEVRIFPPRVIYSFGRKAAPGGLCVFGVRYSPRNLPSFARVESNHSQVKSILIVSAFFTRIKDAFHKLRLIEVKTDRS